MAQWERFYRDSRPADVIAVEPLPKGQVLLRLRQSPLLNVRRELAQNTLGRCPVDARISD